MTVDTTWWDNPQVAASTVQGLSAASSEALGGLVVLHLHALSRQHIAALPGNPLVGMQVSKHLMEVGTPEPASRVALALVERLGHQGASGLVAKLSSDADLAAAQVVARLTATGMPVPTATSRAAAAYGIAPPGVSAYVSKVAAPGLPPAVVQAYAHEALATRAVEVSSDLLPYLKERVSNAGELPVGLHKSEFAFDESEVKRDAQGRFAVESAGAKDRPKDGMTVAQGEELRQRMLAQQRRKRRNQELEDEELGIALGVQAGQVKHRQEQEKAKAENKSLAAMADRIRSEQALHARRQRAADLSAEEQREQVGQMRRLANQLSHREAVRERTQEAERLAMAEQEYDEQEYALPYYSESPAAKAKMAAARAAVREERRTANQKAEAKPTRATASDIAVNQAIRREETYRAVLTEAMRNWKTQLADADALEAEYNHYSAQGDYETAKEIAQAANEARYKATSMHFRVNALAREHQEAADQLKTILATVPKEKAASLYLDPEYGQKQEVTDLLTKGKRTRDPYRAAGRLTAEQTWRPSEWGNAYGGPHVITNSLSLMPKSALIASQGRREGTRVVSPKVLDDIANSNGGLYKDAAQVFVRDPHVPQATAAMQSRAFTDHLVEVREEQRAMGLDLKFNPKTEMFEIGHWSPETSSWLPVESLAVVGHDSAEVDDPGTQPVRNAGTPAFEFHQDSNIKVTPLSNLKTGVKRSIILPADMILGSTAKEGELVERSIGALSATPEDIYADRPSPL